MTTRVFKENQDGAHQAHAQAKPNIVQAPTHSGMRISTSVVLSPVELAQPVTLDFTVILTLVEILEIALRCQTLSSAPTKVAIAPVMEQCFMASGTLMGRPQR